MKKIKKIKNVLILVIFLFFIFFILKDFNIKNANNLNQNEFEEHLKERRKILNNEKKYLNKGDEEIMKVAIFKQNLNYCYNIKNKKIKEKCIEAVNWYTKLEFILNKKDEKKCEELKDIEYIKYCEQEIIFKKNIDLAIKNKDFKICTNLKKEKLINNCENFVKIVLEAKEKKDKNICKKLPEYIVLKCTEYL